MCYFQTNYKGVSVFNALFVLFFMSEFCYYLLIAQTGIVEVFGSDVMSFFTLPLGGIIGSLVVHFKVWKFDTDQKKISLFLAIQTLCSLYYPHLNLFTLFFLGLSLGASAPLLINLVKGRWHETAVALGLTYALATLLFTYPAALRGTLAILLSLSAFGISFFTCKGEKTAILPSQSISTFSIVSMSLWAFLDATLFETLSRSSTISIWRGEQWYIILLFHLIGIISAYFLMKRIKEHNLFISLLFATSYLLYAMNEATLLSMLYPFVISYYNFVIIKRLASLDNVKALGVIMVFTGWLAGGMGLMSALHSLTIIGVVITIGLLSIELAQFIQKTLHQTSYQRINHVS